MTIYAGQRLTTAVLNASYGQADVASTTVTATTFQPLSSVYTIPAGEPQAGSAYELYCAGYGTMGSTQRQLQFSMAAGGAGFGSQPIVSGAALNANQNFSYALAYKLVCADGISAWWCSLQGSLVQSSSNPLLPGTAGDQAVAIADANTGVHTAAVSAAITVSVLAAWGNTGCTITNTHTVFRKIA